MYKSILLLFALLASSLAWAQSSPYVTLSPSESSFARQIGLNPDSVTQEQADKARSMLGGRDPSTLTAPEIDIAKQNISMLKSSKSAAAPTSTQKTETYTSLPPKPFQTEPTDEPFRTPIGKAALRYEVELFSHTLPSTFYEQQSAVSADYPIKPTDGLVLTLWGAVEKEYRLAVNNQGKVNIEGIGLIALNGLTLGKAEAVIRSKLKTVYAGIGDGKIQVNLRPESLSATKVFVLGEVQRAGGYDLPGNSNVFLALYRAKGPTALGSVRNIQITRANGDKNEIDLYELLFKGTKTEQAVLKDGDVVFLPRAQKLVAIHGDVGRPALFELKGNEGLTEAFQFAGNLNPTAAHSVSLWRIMDDGRKDLMEIGTAKAVATGGKAVPLFDGDSIFVPNSSKLPQDYIEIIGSVWYPGQYPWQTGLTVTQAVALAGGARTEALLERVMVKRTLADSSVVILADALNGSGNLVLQPRDQLVVLSQAVLKTPQKIRISGAVKKSIEVDWQAGMTVKTMIALADGFSKNHQKGTVRIERLLPGQDVVSIINLKIRNDLSVEPGQELNLEPGDRIVIPTDPSYYSQELVSIDGAVRNPGQYSLIGPRETFKEFMGRVANLENNAFLEGGRLFRKRGLEFYQVSFSMSDALSKNEANPITLQRGDSIFIPLEALTVQVKGEVVSPGDVIWQKGMSIEDYVEASGGYTLTSDERRVVVAYANGNKATMRRAERDPDPGSVITVPFKKEEETDWYKFWATVATVIGGIAQVALVIIVTQK